MRSQSSEFLLIFRLMLFNVEMSICFDSPEYILITGNGDRLYGVNPNLCWHVEGNPKNGSPTLQMFFQLIKIQT